MKQLALCALFIFQLNHAEELTELLGNGQDYVPMFSAENNIKETLVKLIEEEKKNIKVAIYFLTDWSISKALIEAHKNGIKVEVITDHSSAKDRRYSRIQKLNQEQVPVYVYGGNQKQSSKDGIMHNKFMVLKKNFNNKTIVWTGSFNFTYSAQAKNMENGIIICDAIVAKKYSDHFKRLKKECKKIGKPKKQMADEASFSFSLKIPSWLW